MKKSPYEYGIRRLVLDVMKPHHPPIVDVAMNLTKVHGVSGVNCMLGEVDQETETLKIIIEGIHINYDEVVETLKSMGGVIHSVDSVVTGSKIVEDVDTLQD